MWEREREKERKKKDNIKGGIILGMSSVVLFLAQVAKFETQLMEKLKPLLQFRWNIGIDCFATRTTTHFLL
jgi:hypothetical protein